MHLTIGIDQGSELALAPSTFYKGTMKYVSKTLNITYNSIDLSLETVSKYDGSTGPIKEGIDLIFIPYSYSVSDAIRELYSHTSVVRYGESVLLSGPPEKNQNTSFMNFLLFSKDITALLALVIFLISLVFRYSNVLYHRKPAKKWRTHVASVSMVMIILIESMILQPLPMTLKRLPHRVLISTWLLLVVVVSNLLSSFMKMEVIVSTYHKFDTLDNVIDYAKPNEKLLLLDNTDELLYVKQRALKNERYNVLLQKIIREKGLIDLYQIISPNFYEDINSRKIIFITNTILQELIATGLFQAFDHKLNLYQSKNTLKSQNFGYLISKNVSRHLRTLIDIRIMNIFESKPFEYVKTGYHFQTTKHAWEQPVDLETQATMLKDTYGAYVILFGGYLLASVVLIIQVCSGLFRTEI